jgi:integrase
VRWAANQRITTLSFPATRWHGPTRALDDQARWDATRHLLHDDTLAARDRLAGLLVLLYAQPVARISRLTIDQVATDDTTVRIRLGRHPSPYPEPVAELTGQLLTGKRGHATTGAGRPSPWLFPGGQPGRPISVTHLGLRLKDLGIQSGTARSTALFQRATELPAAILARMLHIHIHIHIHIDVAVATRVRPATGPPTPDVSLRSDTRTTPPSG